MPAELKKREGLEGVFYALPNRISKVLDAIPSFIKNDTYELRLRAEKPVTLTCDKLLYVAEDSSVSTLLPREPLIISKEELYEVLVRLTDRSVYTRAEQLNNGFISMKNGNRAGICGRFSEGLFSEISSVNIRIAREKKGAARCLYDRVSGGLLIAGAPASGKTTVLRDLVRHLSDSGRRVCVVDSRGEIAASDKGVPTLDVGLNTDVITGLDKDKGLEIAVRTMFPNIVAFDEIGSKEELNRLLEGFFAGVTVIATAHASSITELKSREITAKLISSGAVKTVALLPRQIGGKIALICADEVFKYA